MIWEAVIFDLDDTLYDYQTLNEEAIKELSRYMFMHLGLPEPSFYEAFRRARKETKRLLGNTGSSHNRLLYCQKALEYLGIPPISLALDLYEIYWGYLLEHMCLRDGAKELLEFLKERKIKIGICTDLTAHIQHRKIRKLGISDQIDALVSSEEAGAEKPAEIMYQMILEKLNVRPEHTVFIGDDLEKDVMGPQKAGMKAIWLYPETKEPYCTFPNLKKVKEYFNDCR